MVWANAINRWNSVEQDYKFNTSVAPYTECTSISSLKSRQCICGLHFQMCKNDWARRRWEFSSVLPRVKPCLRRPIMNAPQINGFSKNIKYDERIDKWTDQRIHERMDKIIPMSTLNSHSLVTNVIWLFPKRLVLGGAIKIRSTAELYAKPL